MLRDFYGRGRKMHELFAVFTLAHCSGTFGALMNSSDCQARRATIEDLPGLRALWHLEDQPTLELEKRFTEFQVAVDPDNRVLGAVGLRVEGLHGRVHSEVFLDGAQADVLRPILWDRIQVVARNRGLVRLWTREEAPVWRERGFATADADALKKLPPLLGDTSKPWTTIKLKEEAPPMDIEKELELFHATGKEGVSDWLRQAKVFHLLAWVVALVFVVAICYGMFQFVREFHSRKGGRTPSPAVTPVTPRR
jgi:N-acetylglutamate synthase-like GNAT family acetyltransferase